MGKKGEVRDVGTGKMEENSLVYSKCSINACFLSWQKTERSRGHQRPQVLGDQRIEERRESTGNCLAYHRCSISVCSLPWESREAQKDKEGMEERREEESVRRYTVGTQHVPIPSPWRGQKVRK